MVTLQDKAREFGKKYPTPLASPSPSTDTTWDQNCGIAMFQFGSFIGWTRMPSGDISSAYRAYRGSKIESMNPVGAPIGAYHWFDIGGEANGHVMQQVDTNTLVFGGTSTVWEEVGVDLGFESVAWYLSKRPARYLGWSRDYSGGTINLSAVSGTGTTTPITNSLGDKQMRLAWTTDGTGWLVTEDGWQGLPSMQVYNLFRRLIVSNQSAPQPEVFLRAEVDIMNNYLKLLRVSNGAETAIDPIKLAKALSDELVKVGIPVTVENLQDADFTVDPEVLATAFDAVVPRVAKAIVKQAGEAMGQVQ